jgi:phage gpG-like protein
MTDDDQSSDWTRRRRSSFRRAAATHRVAAEMHDAAADFFEKHERPEGAKRERLLARKERDAADEDELNADNQ